LDDSRRHDLTYLIKNVRIQTCVTISLQRRGVRRRLSCVAFRVPRMEDGTSFKLVQRLLAMRKITQKLKKESKRLDYFKDDNVTIEDLGQ
jgi:hypothetical protein